jgi:hypothetical protein
MAKTPSQGASPPPPRPNPLDRPVMTFAAPPRPNVLDRPVMSLQTFLPPPPVAPRLRILDLTAHVLHDEHVAPIVASVRGLDWARDAVLKARPVSPAVGQRLQDALREAMGHRAPSLHSPGGAPGHEADD